MRKHKHSSACLIAGCQKIIAACIMYCLETPVKRFSHRPQQLEIEKYIFFERLTH